MSFWGKAAFYGMRGTVRASKRMGDAVEDSVAVRRLTKVPGNVRRRGYWAPGEERHASADDLPDYTGFADSRSARSASYNGPDAVALGTLWNLGGNSASGAFSVPVSQFFQHMVVVAPPGKGKTFGVVAPLAVRLLRAGATVVTLDVTGDLPEQIRGFAQEHPSRTAQEVRTYHWSLHPRRGRNVWNPLEGLNATDTVAIEGLKAAILGDAPPDPKHRDFHERDLRILGSLLQLALDQMRDPSLTDVAELAGDLQRLEELAERADRYVAAGIRDLMARESDMWSLRNKLDLFLDAEVRSVTSGTGISLPSLLAERSLMIVGAELELRERSKVGSSLFVNRLMSILQGRYGTSDGVPVVLLLDEAPQIAERVDLAAILATARAARCGVVLAAQNVNQFGDVGAQSKIFDSCDMFMLLAGGSEAACTTFQARLGSRRIRVTNLGHDASRSNRNARVDTSSAEVDVAGVRELVDPPFGKYPAFLHHRSLGTTPLALDLDRSVVGR